MHYFLNAQRYKTFHTGSKGRFFLRMVIYIKIIIRACPRLTRPTSLRFVRLVRQGRGEPPYREVAQQSFGGFVSLSPKGSATSAPPNIGGVSEGRGGLAPPNIGGVSEGRGGFAALRIPHAKPHRKHPSFVPHL
jgi:hypothetical protein